MMILPSPRQADVKCALTPGYLTRTIFATDGTPALVTRKSM
jgi:hypothetical protein